MEWSGKLVVAVCSSQNVKFLSYRLQQCFLPHCHIMWHRQFWCCKGVSKMTWRSRWSLASILVLSECVCVDGWLNLWCTDDQLSMHHNHAAPTPRIYLGQVPATNHQTHTKDPIEAGKNPKPNQRPLLPRGKVWCGGHMSFVPESPRLSASVAPATVPSHVALFVAPPRTQAVLVL